MAMATTLHIIVVVVVVVAIVKAVANVISIANARATVIITATAAVIAEYYFRILGRKLAPHTHPEYDATDALRRGFCQDLRRYSFCGLHSWNRGEC
jgi:hypothetical protein